MYPVYLISLGEIKYFVLKFWLSVCNSDSDNWNIGNLY
jgi:hypothetical protein